MVGLFETESCLGNQHQPCNNARDTRERPNSSTNLCLLEQPRLGVYWCVLASLSWLLWRISVLLGENAMNDPWMSLILLDEQGASKAASRNCSMQHGRKTFALNKVKRAFRQINYNKYLGQRRLLWLASACILDCSGVVNSMVSVQSSSILHRVSPSTCKQLPFRTPESSWRLASKRSLIELETADAATPPTRYLVGAK